ncbi:MAG: hypothetical protein AB1486_25245 [Planctomycetota bacterium]
MHDRRPLVSNTPQGRLNLLHDILHIVRERRLFGTSRARNRGYAHPRIPRLPYVHTSLNFMGAETGISCQLACLLLLLAAASDARQGLCHHEADIRLRTAIATSSTGLLAFLASTFGTPDYHLPEVHYFF